MSENSGWDVFGKFVFTVVIAPTALVTLMTVEVLAVKSMWDWFVIPVTNVASPEYSVVFGGLLFIGFIRYSVKTHTRDPDKKQLEKSPEAYFTEAIGVRLIWWGVAWCVWKFGYLLN